MVWANPLDDMQISKDYIVQLSHIMGRTWRLCCHMEAKTVNLIGLLQRHYELYTG